MIVVKSVRASALIRLCILCVFAVQNTTMTLDQCSAESWFDVSVMTLHGSALFLV